MKFPVRLVAILNWFIPALSSITCDTRTFSPVFDIAVRFIEESPNVDFVMSSYNLKLTILSCPSLPPLVLVNPIKILLFLIDIDCGPDTSPALPSILILSFS